MSVFIPQEWEEVVDYSSFATRVDLLNYLEKQSDGSVNMEHKRLVNLGPPTNDSDGVNKEYTDTNYAAKNSQGHINAKRKRIIRLANPEDDNEEGEEEDITEDVDEDKNKPEEPEDDNEDEDEGDEGIEFKILFMHTYDTLSITFSSSYF